MLGEFIYKIHHTAGKAGDAYNRIYEFSDQTGLSDTNSLMYKLNPAWANQIGNTLTTLTTEQLNEDKYKNYLAMGYFCNPENWKKRYVTTEDQAKGVWAVAGASVEMMFASYNDRVLKNDTFSVSIGEYSNSGKYGYLFSPCTGYSPNNDGYGYTSATISNTTCNGMYVNTNKSSWLISPSTSDTNTMCEISPYYSAVRSASPNNENYLRIIVSIPSDYRVTGDIHVRTAKFTDDIVNKIHNIGTYSQITKIERSTTEPNTSNKQVGNLVSAEDSDYSIYMWNNNNILYWYSEFEHPVLPENCSSLLASFSALEYADGIKDWDTSNVTNMYYMFGNCYKLKSLDVSNWNTSNVTNMQYMFGGCFEIANLNVSNWETLKVTNMASLFSGCFKLTFLDLSNWDTSCVTNMNSMFTAAEALQKIIASDKFTVERVTDSENMFSGCTTLKGGNNTAYDSSKTDKAMAHIDTTENPGYFSAN